MATHRLLLKQNDIRLCTKKYEEIENLLNMGAMIHMNTFNIIGADVFGMKKFLLKIMKMNLLHYVGSDAHNLTDRKPCMGKCVAYMEKVMESEYTKKILEDNPFRLTEEKRMRIRNDGDESDTGTRDRN